MKRAQQAFFISLMLLISACSKDGPKQNVIIPPGKFVTNEPSIISNEQIKSKMCSLDTINGKQRKDGGWTVKQGEDVTFSGWAFSSDKKQAASEVYVQIMGPVQTYYAVTTQRHMRSDANQFHQADPALVIGFKLRANTGGIEPGVYEIAILQSLKEKAEFCKTSVSLTIN